MTTMTIAVLGASQDSREKLTYAIQTVAATADVFSRVLPVTGAIASELARTPAQFVFVEVPSDERLGAAVEGITLIRECQPHAKIVAVGDISDGSVIVEAMRAGANDFLPHSMGAGELAKLLAADPRAKRNRSKTYTLVNSKGGSGATTLAVNFALALTSMSDRVALLDLAVPGNAAFHLGIRPSFTLRDAHKNLGRLDALLLQGLMTRHGSGVHVLAGAVEPFEALQTQELAALLDIIGAQYDYVVVDCSTRLDPTVQAMCQFSDQVMMVAQPDVTSMWNAKQVKSYLAGTNADKMKLVLNRHRKTPGVSDADFEKACGCELIWTVPNQYLTVSNAITNGVPVAQQSAEMKEIFLKFARSLTGTPEPAITTVQRQKSKSLLDRVASLKSLTTAGLKPDVA